MTYLVGLDYLLFQLWPWLLLAFALGGLVGWFTCPGFSPRQIKSELR